MATFVLDPTTHIAGSVPRYVRNFPKRQYKDKEFKGSEEDWAKKLARSTTVYVGNLSFYTNEYQLQELFGRCGSVKRIIMGLDKIKKTPCGFSFIEFDERQGAERSITYLNKSLLDGREINVDIDAGFEEGRQFGRGKSGGQIGDERRKARDQQQTQGGNFQGGNRFNRGGYAGGQANIMTRSITVVACIALIAMLMIVCQPTSVYSERVSSRPYISFSSNRAHLLSPLYVKQAQLGNNETRAQFEKSFAQFLVSIMKAAKPTLLKAFISATLADKQLKDTAIALFFNNTDTES